jgi:hypothetical protein
VKWLPPEVGDGNMEFSVYMFGKFPDKQDVKMHLTFS